MSNKSKADTCTLAVGYVGVKSFTDLLITEIHTDPSHTIKVVLLYWNSQVYLYRISRHNRIGIADYQSWAVK